MKIYPSALDVVLATFLVVRSTTTAFVPNSCLTTTEQRFSSNTYITNNQLNVPTVCFANSVDIGDETSSTSSSDDSSSSSSSFPYDEGAIRYAYDEWRLIYGKGDFDSDRFENFTTNHRTLINANIKARENAVQQGITTLPQWMSLNEYGDYSLDEYETMLAQGPQQSNDNMNYSNNYNNQNNQYNGEQQDQYGRPIRSTQVIQQQQSGRSTQVIQSDQQQQQFTNNYNNGQQAGGEYQDQYGRTVRRTQVVDDPMKQATSQTTTTYSSIKDDSNDSNDTNDDDDYNGRGTVVIEEPTNDQVLDDGSVGSNTARGTQVVQPIDQPGNNNSGTQVIKSMETGGSSSSLSDTGYGTQVIQPANNFGTQVVRSDNNVNGSSSSTFGTQVIQQSDSSSSTPSSTNGRSGTQVIKSMDQEGSSTLLSGTRVIQPERLTTNEGTQINSKKDDRGTLVVSKDDKESWTNLLDKLPLFGGGNNVDDSEDNDNDNVTRGTRGTMVIKRQIPEPKNTKSLFNFFNANTDEENQIIDQVKDVIESIPESEPSTNNFLKNFISPINPKNKDDTSTFEGTQQISSIETADSGGAKNKSNDIFSFFGGKLKSENSRSVRTTISLQQNTKDKVDKVSTSNKKLRKTELIPKKQNENGMPSILSFFGGAKKVAKDETSSRDPNARSTLTVNKPSQKPKKKSSSQIWSPFSAKKKTKDDETSTTVSEESNPSVVKVRSTVLQIPRES